MQKKGKPGSGGRPKCKKNASLEAEAGRNTKKTKTHAKKRKKKKSKTNAKKHANAPGNCIFSVFPHFGNDRKRLQLFFLHILRFCFFLVWPASVSGLALFFAFWPAAASRLAFFACWSSLGVRCASFSNFAGPRPLQPRKCCKAKFKHASKHKKTHAKQNSSRPANTKKRQAANAKKQQHKKMQTADAIKKQNKCKTYFKTHAQSVAQRFF